MKLDAALTIFFTAVAALSTATSAWLALRNSMTLRVNWTHRREDGAVRVNVRVSPDPQQDTVFLKAVGKRGTKLHPWSIEVNDRGAGVYELAGAQSGCELGWFSPREEGPKSFDLFLRTTPNSDTNARISLIASTSRFPWRVRRTLTITNISAEKQMSAFPIA
ncbi:hypothetical protein [Lysobacter sp. GCM10012299]|uniref:hypothetical protein n=1 Tax=Lysobacter sp. GCM10012299 TaxID=3317333 RepID=UPI0036137A67